MMLAIKVAARFLSAINETKKVSAQSDEVSDTGWEHWINQFHDEGKEMVVNPDKDSRIKEVQFLTALRNKTFYDKAVNEYRTWRETQKGDVKKSSSIVAK